MKKTTKIIIYLLVSSFVAWIVMLLCWPTEPIENHMDYDDEDIEILINE